LYYLPAVAVHIRRARIYFLVRRAVILS